VTTPNQLSLLSLLTLGTKQRFSAFQDVHYPAHRTALLACDLDRAVRAAGLVVLAVAFSRSGRLPLTPWHYPAALSRALPRALSDNLLIAARKPREVMAPTADAGVHAPPGGHGRTRPCAAGGAIPCHEPGGASESGPFVARCCGSCGLQFLCDSRPAMREVRLTGRHGPGDGVSPAPAGGGMTAVDVGANWLPLVAAYLGGPAGRQHRGGSARPRHAGVEHGNGLRRCAWSPPPRRPRRQLSFAAYGTEVTAARTSVSCWHPSDAKAAVSTFARPLDQILDEAEVGATLKMDIEGAEEGNRGHAGCPPGSSIASCPSCTPRTSGAGSWLER
jgi:hypothetical protein